MHFILNYIKVRKYKMKALLRKNFIILSVWTLVTLPLANAQAGWEATWIERFDGTSVNWNNWTAQTNANYNNEIQCYTDDDSSALRNYDVSNGTLKIIARRGAVNCEGLNNINRPWTSGRLNSKDKAEFLYGRIEARIKFEELRGGTWPAFWALENRIAEQPIKGDNDTVNWPNPGAGEIDIWEWYGRNGSSYITNFFNTGGCGGEFRPQYPGGTSDVQDFNVYAIEWTPDNIKFFLNEQMVVEHDISACPQYKEPMFVLINVAMGGNIGGAIDPTLDTATMEVDYVAHCVASSANGATGCNETTPMVADADGDSVADSVDQCPTTPANVSVDSRGCEVFEEPQQAAPEPEAASENVIALFSDWYDNIAMIDYDPDWGQATQVTQVQYEGDTVLKYSGLNYQGTDFGDNRQDVTAMDNLHFDYWTNDASALAMYLISPGPQETPVSVALELGTWQQVVIPLSEYASVVDLTNTFQLKVTGSGTVYLDNIYFSKNVDSTENTTSSTNTGSVSTGNTGSTSGSTNTNTSTTNTSTSNTTTSTSASNNTSTPTTSLIGSDGSGGSLSLYWLALLGVCIGYRRRHLLN